MTRDANAMNNSARHGSALAVAAAWAVVVLPAAWGITQTARTSLHLFIPVSPAGNQPAASGPTTIPSNSAVPTTNP